MLFSDGIRHYMDPAGFAEPKFAYLDRSARIEMQRVRDVLETWYTSYPDVNGELKARFRSEQASNFMSAFFELYIHELLLRLGYLVEPHPQLSSGSSKHPDYLASTGNGESFYIEIVLATGQSTRQVGKETVENQVLDVINSIDSPNFFLGIDVTGSPNTPPRVHVWRDALIRWIESLDADQVYEQYSQSFDALPQCDFVHDGWKLSCRAFPKSPEARGKQNAQPIGYLGTGWYSDNSTVAIREAIARKADYYGKLDRPYIIAVNALTTFPDKDNFVEALFGTEQFVLDWNHAPNQAPTPTRAYDGAWRGPSGPRNIRVSGVLGVERLVPWSSASQNLTFYSNPWAKEPYAGSIASLPQIRVKDGYLVPVPGIHSRDIFALPEGWPK